MPEQTVWARMLDQIEQRGWAQYRGTEGLDAIRGMTQEDWFTAPCCLLMALGAVIPDHRQGAYVDRMHEHLGITSLGRWNDSPKRTLGDVYALLQELDAEDRAA